MGEMDSEYEERLLDENEIVLALSRDTLAVLLRQIASCESCNPRAETFIDIMLDDILRSDRTRTTYVFSEPIFCPQCKAEISEESLVEWQGGMADEVKA